MKKFSLRKPNTAKVSKHYFELKRPFINYFKDFYDWYLKYYYKRNIQIVGSPSISNNTILGNFSSSNYATLPSVFNPGSSNFETMFCFTTGSSLPGECYVTGNYWDASVSGNALWGYRVEMVNSTLSSIFGFGSSGARLSHSTTITTNTKYWVKATKSGTTYTSYISTDGTNYTQFGSTVNSSNMVIKSGYPQYLGNIYNGYVGGFRGTFNGTIDLSQCYIKINDQYWWKGITENTTGNPQGDWTQDILVSNNTRTYSGQYTSKIFNHKEEGTIDDYDSILYGTKNYSIGRK